MNVVSNLIEAHIFREKGNDLEFLLMKRSDSVIYPGIWQMVTGSINENEKGFQTALREIKEETSLQPEKFWIVPHMNSFYLPEGDYVCLVPVFAALVARNSKVMISEEHTDYKWLSKFEAQKLLAWKGQRESVDTIYEYFKNENSFLKFVEIHL